MDPVGLAFFLAVGALTSGAVVLEPRVKAALDRRRVTEWKRVADALGLDWLGDRMSGWWRGHYVSAFSEKGMTSVAATLWPPLDLGVFLGNHPAVDAQRSVATGVWLHADEPGRAVALASPEVEQALAAEPSVTVLITDEHVVSRAWSVQTHRRVRRMIASVSRVAAAVDAARSGVKPPGRARADAADWAALAARRGAAMTSLPFGFVGRERGLDVRAFTRRRASAVLASAAFAAFREPLRLGFRAASRSASAQSPWGTSRLVLGDPAFDALFDVSAVQPAFAREALNESARVRAATLARAGRKVWIDDYGVLLEADSLVDGPTIEGMLDDATSVAELVDFIHPTRRVAYR